MDNDIFVDPESLEVLSASIIKATGIPEEYIIGWKPPAPRKYKSDYIAKVKRLLDG